MIVAATGLTACESAPQGEPALPAFDTACEEPRPAVCTREYRPVCGLRDAGIRCVTAPCDSTEWRTYGNACDACADPAVYGYTPGECADGG